MTIVTLTYYSSMSKDRESWVLKTSVAYKMIGLRGFVIKGSRRIGEARLILPRDWVLCALMLVWCFLYLRATLCVMTCGYLCAPRPSLVINLQTHSLQGVHICVYVHIYVYACLRIWIRMCVYDIAGHVEASLLKFSICV